MFLDQPVAITQPVNFANGARLKAEYSDNADKSAPKLIPTDANASTKIAQSTTGKTYYVSGSGSDSNNGLSTSQAFRTLGRVGGLVKAGDTVYLMNGTYERNSSDTQIVVLYEKQGTASAPITFKAYPGHNPLIKSKNAYAINIVRSSYIIIEGLTLEGNNNNITKEYALQQRYNSNNPLTKGTGIGINEKSHHITIRNNKISNFGGHGIHSYRSDYVTIEKNIVARNAWYSPDGTSGISTQYNWNSDGVTDRYKMVIRDNIIYDNKNFVPWSSAGKITEGHGIIIDDCLNTQSASFHQRYNGRTLITNNIIYRNGGAGVNVYSSPNVDIVNNTTYQNGQVAETQGLGEIATSSGSDRVKIFNNILYAKTGGVVNSLSRSTNIQYNNNLIYNSSKFNAPGTNNILGKNPLFSDPDRGNFTLRSGSSAIDAGASSFSGINAPSVDQLGFKRPVDGNADGRAVVDIGALEALSKAASAR
ncbi:right-handed parallel beta-helix repeat-containing protein [Calothrix sp. NIES-2098]|uniref:right-handed parallel beta-helix repeat-containing protein n=1 Tax=Calothrix sp. NIES-2098 TaxID=1954171 RepID=UPI000B5E0F74|nr:hemolysin-type calcium-binding region [Calothrix sp. NIES-2098]